MPIERNIFKAGQPRTYQPLRIPEYVSPPAANEKDDDDDHSSIKLFQATGLRSFIHAQRLAVIVGVDIFEQ